MVEHDLGFQFAIGQTTDGTICVNMTIIVCGMVCIQIALPTAMARELAPNLAKELINAANAAEQEQRKSSGIHVVADLPDSLRK